MKHVCILHNKYFPRGALSLHLKSLGILGIVACCPPHPNLHRVTEYECQQLTIPSLPLLRLINPSNLRLYKPHRLLSRSSWCSNVFQQNLVEAAPVGLRTPPSSTLHCRTISRPRRPSKRIFFADDAPADQGAKRVPTAASEVKAKTKRQASGTSLPGNDCPEYSFLSHVPWSYCSRSFQRRL